MREQENLTPTSLEALSIPRFFQPGEDLMGPLCRWFDAQCNQGIPQQEITFFLPTQRSCRHFLERYLTYKGTEAVLLPQQIPMGDFQRLQELLPADKQQALPQPIPTQARRVLLARLLASSPQHHLSFGTAFKVAKELGELLDQLAHQHYTLHDITQASLEQFSLHWSINVSFLQLLEDVWPQMLSNMGYVDQGIYQAAIITAFGKALEQGEIPGTFLLAGSVGSQPLTRHLMSSLHRSSQSTIWLYQDLYASSQSATDDGSPPSTHPSFFPHKTRKSLQIASPEKTLSNPLQDTLFSLTTLGDQDPKILQKKLKKTSIIEAETPLEEAQKVAHITAQWLSKHPQKTLMIISADESLMRQIRMTLESYHIHADNALGTPLSKTDVGSLYLKLFSVRHNNTCDTHLLDLLTHPLTNLGSKAERAACAQSLNILLRKPFTQRPSNCDLLANSAPFQLLQPLLKTPLPQGEHSLETWLTLHQQAFAQFIGSIAEIVQNLDTRQTFDLLHTAQTQLREFSPLLPAFTAADYLLFLGHYMDSCHARPVRPNHPYLLMLDTREARLIQKDAVIMAGMNKNVWPQTDKPSPWMPPLLAKQYDLALPDTRLSLMNHDFLCHLNTAEVYITLSKRREGTPASPSPLVERLRTVARCSGISCERALSAPTLSTPSKIYRVNTPHTAPTPLKEVSLTTLEALAKGYLTSNDILYKNIPMMPYTPTPHSPEKGTLLHLFLKEQGAFLHQGWHTPEETFNALQASLGDFLSRYPHHPEIHGFWRQQWQQALKWLCHTHAKMPRPTQILTEIPGQLTLRLQDRSISIRARMDRIDLMPDGSLQLWDYKTGRVPSLGEIKKHQALQLTFGSLMIERQAFPTLKGKVSDIGYIGLSGKHKGGDVLTLPLSPDLIRGLDEAVHELLHPLVYPALMGEEAS